MTIYDYIAINDPDFVRVICNKYGYSIQNVQTVDQLGVCLQQIVAEEGEGVFREIVDQHPDKDLILEMYASEAATAAPGEKKCKCDGKGSKVQEYLQAASGSNGLQQGNLFLIAAALILAVAIIVKK